ncbi:MAG TPA: DHA2 family efflux MFS transporter permease subunit [Streptosporangiaceae bacterium]|nr:DHA2 family efflux MFS transporter permease subunit [Streptosporangiaceae bacterium]
MTDSRTADAPPPAPTKIDRQIIVLGLVVISGTIMAILDMTIVNVALDTLARDFTTELSTIQWVVTGYMLALGTVIPLTGWAIDRFGAKRIWMLSIVLFVAGSALSGASWSIGSLIAFRVIQGLGGGMLMPTGMSILTMAAGPQRMGRVMSIIGVPMLLGPVLGPVLGGWLVEDVDWRWIFYVNVPVGALALTLAAWRIPGGRGGAGATALDLRGLLLLPPGFVLVIYGLSTASGHGGFGDPATIAWLVAGVVLIGLFVLHSLNKRDKALIDVRLFANRTFSAAAFGIFLVGISLIGSLLLLPLYFQVVRGEGALAAGLLLAPQGLGAATAMPVAGLLTDRLGAGRIVPFGIVLILLGTFAYTQVGADTSYWLLGGSLYVRGLGLGATMMPTMSAALTTLTKAVVPRASSSLNIIMQLGGSFGSALLAVILSREITDRLPATPGGEPAGGRIGAIPDAVRERFAPTLADAFGHTFWVAFWLTVVLLVPALLLPRHGSAGRAGDSPEAQSVGSSL